MSWSKKAEVQTSERPPCPYIISRSPFYKLTRPDYIVYRYGHGIFKVIRMKVDRSGIDYIPLEEKGKEESSGIKLDNNLSRTKKTVFELALCNEWKWFITITLDRKKVNDRYDLIGFRKILSDWIKNRRRAYGTDLKYMLIPEHHKDGAWHLHGFINDAIPESQIQWHGNNVPSTLRKKLRKMNYRDWTDCGERWGFCSMGLIRDQYATACYVTKYITKDLGGRSAELGKHLYYASIKMKKAERAGEFYGNSDVLNACLQKHYDFCSVGMVTGQKDNFARLTCNVLPWGEPDSILSHYGPLSNIEEPYWRPLEKPVPETFDPYEIDPFAYDRNRNELAQMKLW